MHTPIIKVAQVDLIACSALKDRFDIHEFPTLILFKDSEEQARYDGELTAKGIQDWIFGITDAVPDTKEFGMEDLTTAFTAGTSIFLLRSYKDEDEPFVKEFNKAAQYHDEEEIRFYQSDVTGSIQMQLGF